MRLVSVLRTFSSVGQCGFRQLIFFETPEVDLLDRFVIPSQSVCVCLIVRVDKTDSSRTRAAKESESHGIKGRKLRRNRKEYGGA
mgnify:CR=1 FL=1